VICAGNDATNDSEYVLRHQSFPNAEAIRSGRRVTRNVRSVPLEPGNFR